MANFEIAKPTKLPPDGPVWRDSLKMKLQVPGYTQFCRRQANLKPFLAPVPPSAAIPPEAIYVVIDSTGLKVYGEGDGDAHPVKSQKARSGQTPYLAQTASGRQRNYRTGNQIHAVGLTTNAVSDAQMVKPLVAQIAYPIAKLSGDGAYL